MVDPVGGGPVSGAKRLLTEPREISRARSGDGATQIPATGVDTASAIQLMDLAADLAKAGPPVDYARIAQIKRAIADGSYDIDVNAVARSILNFAPRD